MSANEIFCASLFLARSPARAILLAAIPILILLAAIAYRRREGTVPASAAPGPDAEDKNRYWVAGIFYVNANDPALMVRKRYGFGWTLNFGHWISWLILAVPIVIGLLAASAAGRH
jgi:uncharacterized membrane protein